MIEEVKVIRRMVSREEFIIQLAEEANELAIAALDLKKVSMFEGSIHKRFESSFIEEIADVKLCIDIIGDYLDDINANTIINFRLKDILLEELAQKCCELSKAAIKLRRTIVKNGSPTPVTEREAELKLIEEIINVKSHIDAIGNYWDSNEVNRIYKEKAVRCINRMSNC